MNISGETIAIVAVKPTRCSKPHISIYILRNTGHQRGKSAFGRNNFIKDNLLAKYRESSLQTRVKEKAKLLQDGISFDHIV